MSICEDQPPKFQFTHPGRGATIARVVGDVGATEFQFTHPGRGATKLKKGLSFDDYLFQFTHPGRGATFGLLSQMYSFRVSIHAPREGCD